MFFGTGFVGNNEKTRIQKDTAAVEYKVLMAR